MKLEDWKIDESAGRPILTYKGCSVIEAEDAEFVMGLLRAALPHERKLPSGGTANFEERN